jgi:hypothetical protein
MDYTQVVEVISNNLSINQLEDLRDNEIARLIRLKYISECNAIQSREIHYLCRMIICLMERDDSLTIPDAYKLVPDDYKYVCIQNRYGLAIRCINSSCPHKYGKYDTKYMYKVLCSNGKIFMCEYCFFIKPDWRNSKLKQAKIDFPAIKKYISTFDDDRYTEPSAHDLVVFDYRG